MRLKFEIVQLRGIWLTVVYQLREVICTTGLECCSDLGFIHDITSHRRAQWAAAEAPSAPVAVAAAPHKSRAWDADNTILAKG